MDRRANERGLEARRDGRIHEAVAHFELAARHDDVVAIVNYAYALHEIDDVDEAERQVFRALDLDPRFPLAAAGAIMMTRCRDPALEASALHHAEMAVRYLEPVADDADTLSNLGMAYWYAGETDKAMDTYNRAIRIDPDHEEARFGRAQILLWQGDFEQGWADYACRNTA